MTSVAREIMKKDVISVPTDMDTDKDWEVRYLYLCDDATLTEGEWNVQVLGVADDDADAAVATEYTVLDTPAAQNDWNLTGPMVVAAANVGASDSVVYMNIYHDISDPLCNAANVNWAGALITYTTNVNH